MRRYRYLILFLAILALVPPVAYTLINVDVDSNNAVDVDKGGTNATTASGARTNLGVPGINGTPALHLWAVWYDSATVKAVTVTGSKVVCTDANGEPVACTNLTDVAPLTNPMTTQYDMIYGGASGAPTRVATSSSFITFIGTPTLANLGSLLSDEASGLITFMTTPTLANLASLITDDGTGSLAALANAPNAAGGYLTSAAKLTNLASSTLSELSTLISDDGTGAIAALANAPNATGGYMTVVDVIDGSAGTGPTAAQMKSSSCVVSNYGQAASDVAVALPVPDADGMSCLFQVETAQSNKWGVRAGTNDNIRILAADGTIGTAGSDNGYARMTAAQVGQNFACWSYRTGASAWDWQCKAISIGTSTFAAN